MKFVTSDEYKKTRPKDKGAKNCPFCIPPKENKDHEIRQNNHRIILYPTKPCGGVHRYKKHLLLIPKKHHTKVTQLTSEELLSKAEAEGWLENYFGESEYCTYVRNSDGIKTILHLHYHYFWGNIRYRDIENSLLHYDEVRKDQKGFDA